MCFAIPGIIIEIKGEKASVDYLGETKVVDTSLVENLLVGDYVIVQNKFAIEKVDKKLAEEALEIIKNGGDGDA
ncbi:HypC/HybG/HupF family hydrogenase formation chaperone [Candidatus Woesearchaeota archaeon]|nr:HypC/HybG/HupF family hydrogenase formation chaperone [Candidatus Woesearchaeota archaeon]